MTMTTLPPKSKETPAPPDAALLNLVEFLSRPSSYPERPRRVEHVETHISHVFLTDRHAFKLKKPVQFDFLDFSTPALRRAACDSEVRLNRRMAPGVYLGVVPIALSRSGKPLLGGSGTPVDWVVKMRRLPADRMLDKLIAAGQVSHAEVERLADRLMAFYRDAAPLVISAERYSARIEEHVRANRQELLAAAHALPEALVRRVHAAQLWLLSSARGMFDIRSNDGRVIDGHGDLRPEHVCLEIMPVVFDCIEFNAEFRQLDVLDELAFFAMECERLGAAWIGQRILEAYAEDSHDTPDKRLLSFYQCYRACVRAKVAALRAEQELPERRGRDVETALQYLNLAQKYAEAFERRFVVVLRGLIGSGKSTLARAIAEKLGVERLSTDEVRRRAIGRSATPEPFGGGHYSPAGRLAVYRDMISRAVPLVSQGLSIVLDGTFLEAETLTMAKALAESAQAELLVVECHCPDDAALSRVAERLAAGSDASEARPEFLAMQRARRQAIPQGIGHLLVDTTALPPVLVNQVMGRLAARG
ncbi:MAG: AAA family ATPase [Planctomycetia bacterium]|nr:AAA family ATPase [Planctomycetia bacterium]